MVFPQKTLAENQGHHGMHERVESPGRQASRQAATARAMRAEDDNPILSSTSPVDTVLHSAGGGQADAGAMAQPHQSALRNRQVVEQLNQIIGVLGQRQRTGAATTAPLAAGVVENHTTPLFKPERHRPPVGRRLGRPVQEDNGRSAVIFAERFVMEAQTVRQITKAITQP